MTQIEGLMTSTEVCEYLHISKRTLHYWVRARILPAPVRFGRETCWKKDAVDRAMDARFARADKNVRRI